MYIYTDGSGDQITAQVVGTTNPGIYVTISNPSEEHKILITNAVELDAPAARELAAALIGRANELDPAGALWLTRTAPEQAARDGLAAVAAAGSALIEQAARRTPGQEFAAGLLAEHFGCAS